MTVLVGGIGLLVSFMLVVMGVPFVHYLRREGEWERSGKKLEKWYN